MCMDIFNRKYVATLKRSILAHEASNTRQAKLIEQLRTDRDGWRAKYELFSLTPEAKADVEAAFARGAEAERRQIVNTILGTPTRFAVSKTEGQ